MPPMDDRLKKLEDDVGSLKNDVHALDIKIQDVKSSLIQWMVGIALGGVAIVISVMMGFGNVMLRHIQDSKPVATQQPPVVINIPAQPSTSSSPPAAK